MQFLLNIPKNSLIVVKRSCCQSTSRVATSSNIRLLKRNLKRLRPIVAPNTGWPAFEENNMSTLWLCSPKTTKKNQTNKSSYFNEISNSEKWIFIMSNFMVFQVTVNFDVAS